MSSSRSSLSSSGGPGAMEPANLICDPRAQCTFQFVEFFDTILVEVVLSGCEPVLDLFDADILFGGCQRVAGPESRAVDDVGLVQRRLVVAGAFDDSVGPGVALVSLVDPPLE